MSKVSPFIIFVDRAEEAVDLYVSLIPNSRIIAKHNFPAGAGQPEDKVMTVSFELDGIPYIALNGGEPFVLTDAFSLVASCDSQAEMDHLWEKLTENGGKPIEMGWLKDRFGLDWQIVPRPLTDVMQNGTAEQIDRVMKTVWSSPQRLNFADIEAAVKG